MSYPRLTLSQPLPSLQSQGKAFSMAVASWGLLALLNMYFPAFRLLQSTCSAH